MPVARRRRLELGHGQKKEAELVLVVALGWPL
jgi:hypothetical protein